MRGENIVLFFFNIFHVIFSGNKVVHQCNEMVSFVRALVLKTHYVPARTHHTILALTIIMFIFITFCKCCRICIQKINEIHDKVYQIVMYCVPNYLKSGTKYLQNAHLYFKLMKKNYVTSRLHLLT